MPIRKELLDELLKEYKNPDDLLGEDGLLKQLTKALVERAMEAELTHHLGYEKHAPEGRNSGNSRNGTSSKTVTGKNGQLELEVPRKRQKRFDGFDEKIISMYARGMTVREIQAHLEEIYSVEVSPDLISSVTDAVIDQVRAWQARPLDALYPILYLDALVVKVREQGRVTNRAVYVAIGVNASGHKEVLGFWIAETEGAKFWLSVVTELRNRGIKDLFLACVDGLKGFAEAIEAVFPQALVQSCIVHQMRNSLAFVSYKDRKGVAASLKPIYRAVSEQAAVAALEEFEAEWSERYPLIGKSWRANWTRITPFFAFPDEIRRAVYTTNAIESLNYSLRKIIKNRSLFPNDEALSKLLYLALNNASKKWRMPIKDWGRAMSQFAILFEDRVPLQLP
jgi:putative transposase